MENTPKILYEYYLNNGEIRQTECTIISQKEHKSQGTTYQYERENMYGSKFVSEKELGVVHNNHIYAFDNGDTCKRIFTFDAFYNINLNHPQLTISPHGITLKLPLDINTTGETNN